MSEAESVEALATQEGEDLPPATEVTDTEFAAMLLDAMLPGQLDKKHEKMCREVVRKYERPDESPFRTQLRVSYAYEFALLSQWQQFPVGKDTGGFTSQRYYVEMAGRMNRTYYELSPEPRKLDPKMPNLALRGMPDGRVGRGLHTGTPESEEPVDLMAIDDDGDGY